MLRAILELGQIKVEIEGLSVSEIVKQIKEDEFQTMVHDLQALQKVLITSSAAMTNRLSDYVRGSTATSISDKVLLCITYSSRYGDERVFNKNDVEHFLFEIREAQPTNTNAVLNSLEKQGFLVRHREKKQGLLSFYLSQRGLDYVSDLRGVVDDG